MLTAVGGLVARNIYQPAPSSAATPPAAAPPPTTTSGAQVDPPGPPTVQLSIDAAASPYGSAVQQVLQKYYDAINAQDYEAWDSVVTASLAAANPKPTWTGAYSTTKDGGMYVYRIDAAPNSALRVLLSFTSTQSIDKAPPFAPYTCINWHSVLPLVRQDGGWRVDYGSNGQHPPTTQCQN